MRVRSRSRTRSHTSRVDYRVAPAESSSLESETIDLRHGCAGVALVRTGLFLCGSAQDPEAGRRARGDRFTICCSSAGIDQVVNRYYYEIVGPFWPAERALVERFTELPFPFQEKKTPSFQMNANWNMEQLLGYLRSWSATQGFMAARGEDPLEQIRGELRSIWENHRQRRRVTWPLILRVGVKGGHDLAGEASV